MRADEITPSPSTTGPVNRQFEFPRKAPSHSLNPKGHEKDVVNKPKLDHIQFNRLEASNAFASDISFMIREVNQAMETIGAHLEKMRSSLERIVKIYPPYPPGSSERIEALRQFSALRKMIDQIVQPDPALSMKNILGDPAATPLSGDWTIQVGGQDNDMVIRHQAVHSGKTGLNLPDMDADSPDHRIRDAIGQIDSAIETLISKRRHFIADANHLIAKV